MYLAIITFMVVEFQKYVMQNYDEIRPNLVRSHFSDFIEQNILNQ